MKAPTLEDSLRTMPAGRDLDQLVALQIGPFRYLADWFDVEDANEAGETVMHAESEDVVMVWPSSGEPYVWCPSTDIGQAWQVQEHISGFVVDFDHHAFGHLSLDRLGWKHGWVASYDTIIEDDEWFEHVERYPRSATGETAPLAICRASLLACALLPNEKGRI